jgi:hypothetical protein
MAAADAEAADRTLKPEYRAGGISALIAVAFALVQVIINIISVGILHIAVPSSVPGWFALLQSHPLIGLNDLTFFQIPSLVFCVPMFLALYPALRDTNRTYLRIGLALAFLGMAVYLASNTALGMLSLSSQYAAAATELEKTMLLAAGQAMLATYEGSGVDVGLIIFLVAVLMLSAIMLRSQAFTPLTAYAGILAGAFAVAYYIAAAFRPEAIFILEAAGLLFVLWVILVGRKLLQLAGQAMAGATRV